MTQSETLTLAADCARYRAALIAILNADGTDYERLDDAIRDMLDISCGWCRPMNDAEKLQMISTYGNQVLAAEPSADTAARTPQQIAAEALGFPFANPTETTERND